MLSITPQASEAIRGILASEQVPEGAVLRLSSQEQPDPQTGPGLVISVTDSPPPEDKTVEGDEVEVSVEPTAAEILDDKQLDATVSEGQVAFTIGDQGGG